MTVSPATSFRRSTAGALIAVLSGIVVISALSTEPASATTPKLGAKCLNSERGKTTNLLVCSKVGSKISWVKRKNPVTGGGGGTGGDPAVIGGPTPGVARPLDVIALVSGTAPAAAAIKIDVTCAGLFGTPTQSTQSASFSGQGGTQSLSFNLVDPGSANPTGSTCTATGTVTGATPSLRILINGRPAAGPASTTVSAPAFGPGVVTLLADFGGSGAPAATTTTAPVGAAPTTTPGATTTTIAGTPTAPPASGRPEVSTKFIGTVPPGLTNVDVSSTCTSPTAGSPFQTNTNRFGRVDGTAVLPQTLAAATATTQATSCQITATLLGTDLGSPSLRVLLNGIAIAGPTSGNLINSPSFAAPSAFGATVEITYPGAATTTTTIPGATTTTTIAGATTTTVAPAAGATTITLSRTGTAPASVTGYVVVLDCQNVRQGTGAASAIQFTPLFGTSGGTSSYVIGYDATSTCVIKVLTSVNSGSPAVTTGTINVSVRGTALPATTNGSFTSGVISVTAPFAVAITVAY
jgi:hypothetical protein